jgi:DNA-binding transcriptional ArsR family regulator
MVEYSSTLDVVFHSLADSTRRDILKRVSKEELSISTLAKPYNLSFAAVAKHVAVLEGAKLIRKKKVGKEQIVSVVPETFSAASACLAQYEKIWNARFAALDTLLKNS